MEIPRQARDDKRLMRPSTSELIDKSQLDYGSFRDPSGFVFYYQDEVYRAIDQSTSEVVRKLESDGLLKELSDEGLIVATEVVDEDSDLYTALRDQVQSHEHFLHHQKIPFVSYPYEWSSSMLASAAELQLRLQLRLVEKGFSLKDASAYNTQFVEGRPVFIDIPSIEIPPRLDIWIAYGQFCRMFLFPLMLKKRRSVDLRSYFSTKMDGMDINEAYKVLGPLNALRPSLFIDVFLQRLLQRGTTPSVAQKERLADSKGGDSFAQVVNLKRLLKKVRGFDSRHRLAHRRVGGNQGESRQDQQDGRADDGRSASCESCQENKIGEGRAGLIPATEIVDVKSTLPVSKWADYASQNSYSETAEKGKVGFVTSFLEKCSPASVLDLGCNTGVYSVIAAEHGARVVAVDADHDSVDLLYSGLCGSARDVLPLCMDIANMSPGLGFRNRERKSFIDRADFDCVFALALIHHMLVTSRIPMGELLEFFASLTGRWLVLEFVPVDDAMFQTLLGLRENIYQDITTDSFEAAASASFRIIEKKPLPDSKRSMYLLEKE